MSRPVGISGIGGSLGECALCGGMFLKEILLRIKVIPFTIEQFHDTMYAHEDCIKKYNKCEWKDLPPESMIRKAFERELAKESNATKS